MLALIAVGVCLFLAGTFFGAIVMAAACASGSADEQGGLK